MKKNLKLTLSLAGCILLNHQVFCDQSSSDVVAAINQQGKNITGALISTDGSTPTVLSQLRLMSTQINNLFDTTFNAEFDPKTKVPTALSTLDKKIKLYAENFYSWFTTINFTSLDFSKKTDENNAAVRKLLSQEIGYNTQKDLAKKTKDTNSLLSQPVELDNNNINAESLGVLPTDKDVTPYGSMDANAPAADSAPNVNDLIGKDSYASVTEQNQAKLFISYLLKSVPPPKNFYIPSKTEAKGNKVQIYIPSPSANSPYTTLDGGVSTANTDSEGKSEYDRMVDFLNSDSKYYQRYKMKTRAANIARTLYLENLFRLYQERVKDLNKKDDQSLVEKEKDMALAALDKKYYDDLKGKSVADINLETLHAINKLAYFLYKIHQDNERSAMVVGTSALQLSGSDSQDEMSYIKPIGVYIKNRCWNDLSNASNDRAQACADPMTASIKP